MFHYKLSLEADLLMRPNSYVMAGNRHTHTYTHMHTHCDQTILLIPRFRWALN